MTLIVSLSTDVLVWQIPGISAGIHNLGVPLSWGIPGVLGPNTTFPWMFSLCSSLWLSPALESDPGIVLPVEKKGDPGMAGGEQRGRVWTWEQRQWDNGPTSLLSLSGRKCWPCSGMGSGCLPEAPGGCARSRAVYTGAALKSKCCCL